MRQLKTLGSFILLSAIGAQLTACTDPIVMLPGGKLSGEVKPALKTWQSVPDVVQLEMRPDSPYSVNIWAVVSNGKLYVATQDAKWQPFIEAEDDVRLRIDSTVYELEAEQVDDAEELMAAAAVYREKYDYDSDEPMLSDASVYRLEARD